MEIYIFGLWVKRRKSFRIGKFPNSTVTPWSLLFSAGAGNLGKSLRVIYKRAGCTNPIITRTKTPLNNFSALPIGVISSHDQTWKFSNNLRGHSFEAKSFWHLLGNITDSKGLIPWFCKTQFVVKYGILKEYWLKGLYFLGKKHLWKIIVWPIFI